MATENTVNGTQAFVSAACVHMLLKSRRQQKPILCKGHKKDVEDEHMIHTRIPHTTHVGNLKFVVVFCLHQPGNLDNVLASFSDPVLIFVVQKSC
jgi:hypothetical protein